MEDAGVEFSGRTVADAIRQAETQLGASRDDLTIDIVTAGRSGVFGIGAEPARVRAARKQPIATVAVDSAGGITSAEEAVIPAVTVLDSDVAYIDEEDDDEESGATSGQTPVRGGEELAEEAATVLRELLRTMGFDAGVTVRSSHDPVMLGIVGGNLGVLIGRRGDNLSALQFMVNLILSKNRRQWPRIVIDVENYRARREESLRALADRIAYRVRRQGRPFTLEAMPAGDRRVIHLTLREMTDIETYSIGEGIARRVVIAPRRNSDTADDAEYS